ncbi:Transposon Tn7 transposition protein TnsB [Burkholderia sp. AD24]|nr:Transposon Tn7 transposition protein TnsB [Burkholderia sp. AD24]
MLYKNDVFEATDGYQYRVLKPTKGPGYGWVINISQAHQWPVERDFGALRQHQTTVNPQGSPTLPDFAFFPKKSQDRANAAYEVIKPLLYNGDNSENALIFDEAQRSRLVRKRADELGISKTTVYRYLNLWWSQGQSKIVLTPGYATGEKRKAIGTSGKGRRPDDERYVIFQMSADDVKLCKQFIQKKFIKKALRTLTGVHAELCERHYSFVDGNGKSILKPEGERPSIHQLRGVLKKHFTIEETLRGKKGDKEFEREHNAFFGTSQEGVYGVGHIYEIDATIADVFLVAMANRASIIGKPTLYLIYDRKSRLCTGFYVGLENASWTGAMLAILSIATDKRALCAKYGVEYDPADWPADGVFPARFVGDRGEMASRNSDRICDGMESTISNTQSLLPIRKGLVECGFKLTHQSIKDEMPGYDPPFNSQKRRAVQYPLDAALTLDEFISNILQSIIKHNRTVMEGYPLSPQYILTGIPAIPRVLWNEDIVNNTGSVSRYPYEYLQKQLLPRGQAIVTQEGIRFEELLYKSDDNTIKQWMISAGANGKFNVSCSYDARLVDSITVYGSHGESFSCQLKGDSKEYAGYSFAEVKFIFVEKRRLDKSQGQNKLQERVNLARHIRQIATPAVKAAKAATAGAARSTRRADTALARQAEKTWRRQNEVAMPTTTTSASIPNNVFSLKLPTDMDRPHQPERQAAEPVIAPVNTSKPAKLSVAEMLRRRAQEKTDERINR